jgi:hypothetical protein
VNRFFRPKRSVRPHEDARAPDRADEVEGACRGRLPGRQTKRVLVGKHARDRADESDLEPVQNPGDAEPRDHEPVPTAPGQPVEAARDHRLDDVSGRAHPAAPGVAVRHGPRLPCFHPSRLLAGFVEYPARRVDGSPTRPDLPVAHRRPRDSPRRGRPSRAWTAPAIRAAPAKTFTFLKLALGERVETVGSATEARDGR